MDITILQNFCYFDGIMSLDVTHTNIFPKGVVHRVENGWGLTIVAAVLLNALIWQKMIYILKFHIYSDILSCGAKKKLALAISY